MIFRKETKMSHLCVSKALQRVATVASFGLLVGAPALRAQNFVEYSAKFVCGTATTTTPNVQPDTYSTTINIHNPHDDLFSTQASTTFQKKAVLSPQEGAALEQPSAFVTENLPNDFAEEVDCAVIRKLLKITSATSFIEGYVVLIVPPTKNSAGKEFTNELDVVGVYTDGRGGLAVQPANEHIVAPGTT